MTAKEDFNSEQIARLACGISNVEKFRMAVLSGLNRSVGYDCAAVMTPTVDCSKGEIKASIRMDLNLLQYMETNPGCLVEFDKIKLAMSRQNGVAIDTDVFGPRNFKRTEMYLKAIRHVHGQSTLYGSVALRDHKLATIILGRFEGYFHEKEAHKLQRLLEPLAVAEASYEVTSSQKQLVSVFMAYDLSPKERELLSYIRLGLTNREIACALGSSPYTVRNQLSILFKKCEVSTRSELVALSCGVLPY